MQEALAFGPVPSRRLGRSLGINNVPPKTCTYSCVYCQLGSAVMATTTRRTFFSPADIRAAVMERLADVRVQGEEVDYLTFVPDGEPTLDANLGQSIAAVIKVAVISNGSLTPDAPVRQELSTADWVSLKVDATTERIWRRVDRPHRDLRLGAIMQGMLAFRESFHGFLATETMLVRSLNDAADELESIPDFLALLRPEMAYIAIPTRPPAAAWVQPAEERTIQRAYQVFRARGVPAELLIGYEGDAFTASGDARSDLLSIMAVHPMRSDAVEELLRQDGADWGVVAELVGSGALVELEYEQERFYMRKLPSRSLAWPGRLGGTGTGPL